MYLYFLIALGSALDGVSRFAISGLINGDLATLEKVRVVDYRHGSNGPAAS